MAAIIAARAIANNEVAFIAWDVDGPIPGCLGFDVVRLRSDGSEPPRGLATFVPFLGQDNPAWAAQDTGVWPVQKLCWRDLTLRRHRADVGVRDANFAVRYAIRPVGDLKPGLESVPVRQPKSYTGPARPLGYLGAAVLTNEVTVGADLGTATVAFTNGILSAQWLRHALESAGKTFDMATVSAEIADRTSAIRAYLTGDVLSTVAAFLTDPAYAGGSVRLALYELSDAELIDRLIAERHRVEVILSNSSRARGGSRWDELNQPARQKLKRAGVTVHDRLFNNSRIGHNKFAVWFDAKGTPRAVMTGSTNWTPTGLCGQSNNALIVRADAVAAAYAAQWQRLKDDAFPNPKPPTAAGGAAQVQGAALRTANAVPADTELGDGSPTEIWFAPNTRSISKGRQTPPDLAELFARMQQAKQAILFLAFLPSRAGQDSIIAAALAAAKANPALIVAGAISDVTAMPGYVAPDPSGRTAAARAGVKPYTYADGRVQVVRAAALNDMVGDFEKELLKVGNAVVHDKIVVIDPLSADCVVATGSHNLGFKASYENDENLLLVSGDGRLAGAYATHVLDVYDHYRFRAWQAQSVDEGQPLFSGHLEGDSGWLTAATAGDASALSRYFATGTLPAPAAPARARTRARGAGRTGR